MEVPTRHLTPEEVLRIDAVLEEVKGNRLAAAMVLKMDNQRLRFLIRDNKTLRAKWCENLAEPVEEGLDTTIDRPAGLTINDAAVVQAIEKQDKLVAERGARLPGLSKKQQTFFGKLLATYANQHRFALDAAQAGASHAIARLTLALEDVAEKIADIEANPQNYTRTTMGQHGESVTKTPAEFYADYTKLLVSIAEALRKMQGTIQSGTEIRLRARKLERELQDKTPKKVPGWVSPAVEGEVK